MKKRPAGATCATLMASWAAIETIRIDSTPAFLQISSMREVTSSDMGMGRTFEIGIISRPTPGARGPVVATSSLRRRAVSSWSRSVGARCSTIAQA